MRPGFHIAFLVLISGLLISGCGSRKTTGSFSTSGNEESFDALFIDACTHFNNGNYATAVKLFKRCVALRPEEASSYYHLSRSYCNLGDNPLCLQNAMQANKLAASNVYYAIWCAKQLRNTGNTAEAKRVLETANAAAPADEPLAIELDLLYALNPQDLDKRIDVWLRYKKAKGYKLNTALRLVELYKLKKDYRAAHQQYDEIKASSPRKHQYFIDDANLYLEQKDEVSALLNFEKARELQPLNFHLNYSIFRLYDSNGKSEEASNALKLAFSDPQTDADIKLKACAELKQKSLTNPVYLAYAVAAVETLLKQYPENDKFLFTSAVFLESSGNLQAALEAYKKVCKINPNMFESWQNAIRICDSSANWAEKAEIAEQALEYFPSIASLYVAAAQALNALKQFNKALEYGRGGISFAYDDSMRCALLVQQGISLFGKGSYSEAESVWTSAAAICKPSAGLDELLGDAAYKLGKQDLALQYWKKAFETDSRNSRLAQKVRNGKYVE